MSKPVFGLLLGGILGIFDGLTALISAPETRPEILGIVIGSTVKGLIAGLLIGFFARKVKSLALCILFGLVVGAFLAYLVTIGGPYLWEIVLPGSLVGIIVGFATQRYGGARAPETASRAGVLMLLLALVVPAAWAGEMPSGKVDGKAAFATLKTLAGHWDGKAEPNLPVAVNYRVTGNGTVVMQTLFAGTDHEMINMYHMVGSDLVATHYCSGGTQPHFKLDMEKSTPTELVFAFDGGTSFDPAKDGHIHNAKIILAGDGKLREEWTFWAGGKEAGTHKFDAVRK